MTKTDLSHTGNGDHCKHCGACPNHERCDHCGHCRKCGVFVAPYRYTVTIPTPWIPAQPVWPSYPYWITGGTTQQTNVQTFTWGATSGGGLQA